MKKTEKTYHDNGNIHFESELNEKGERHGIQRIYHVNGQLKAELNWTNGIQNDGEIISYHDNGIKARQVVLLNGDLNGEFSEWHENGQLKKHGVYNENIPTIQKEWDQYGELEDSKFKEYGVANLQEIIKNEWSEELDHIRLGITRRVDHFESNEESNQGVEYTSIEYSLKIKLYYEGDDEYEDDYETPGLVIVDFMLNDSNGAILSSSEREGLVFCDPKSEETYFFDEFEELFNSDVKYFGDHLIAEFNNAINDFGKAWGNPSDDQNDKIELEKLFDFKKILIRLQEYQAKNKV